MSAPVYAQTDKNICAVIGDPAQRMDFLFPNWHIVGGQTTDIQIPESDPVVIYDNTYYLYKDFLGFRGANVHVILAAFKHRVPVSRYPSLSSLTISIDEGISFSRREGDFRQDENNLKRLEADSYAGLIASQHRDVNLVQYEGVWYYLIFYKRNGSEGDIDQGNLFNVYVLKPDYSIDYICTGEAK